jgi:hypothetical protein
MDKYDVQICHEVKPTLDDIESLAASMEDLIDSTNDIELKNIIQEVFQKKISDMQAALHG